MKLGTRVSAYLGLALLLLVAGVVAWLGSGLAALGLGAVAVWVAGATLARLRSSSRDLSGSADENFLYWSGLIALLFFVASYRIFAGSPWAQVPFEPFAFVWRSIYTPGLLALLLLLGLVTAAVVAWVWRAEPAREPLS